jgi:RiboL-PSP-HEPN
MLWPPREVEAIRARLEELAELVKHAGHDRSDEAAWLARLLVVRSCGYVEQTTLEVLRAYVHERSYGLVRPFALSWLERSRSPTPDGLVELLGRFDDQLAKAWNDLLDGDDQRLRRELGFLVDRRHKIAHGLNEGVTIRKALDLYEIALEVAEWITQKLEPKSGT